MMHRNPLKVKVLHQWDDYFSNALGKIVYYNNYILKTTLILHCVFVKVHMYADVHFQNIK